MKNIRYINAGAGSGKTYTLSHILSDSLLGKGRNKVDASEVILTTFTKAAAAEFREKARAVLIEAGYPDKAAELERAAIGTVHSICEQFVQKYWFSLGLSPQMKVISEEDREFYVNQSISRLTTSEDIRAFNELCIFFNISVKKDDRQELNFGYWKDYVKKVIEEMTVYCIDSLEESLEKSCDLIDSIYDGCPPDEKKIGDFLDKLEKTIRAYRIKSDGTINDTVVGRLDKVSQMRRNVTIPSTIYQLHKWITEKKGNLAGTKNYLTDFNSAYPDFSIDDFRTELEGWMMSKDYGERLKDIVTRVFNIAGKWKEDYRKYKADNLILDFNDLEQYFLRILTEADLSPIRNEISATYKLLMVDEFQDSNPVQIRIFDILSDLVANNGGETFWVGDPKQSIYGFRGSDTALVNDITSKFEPESSNPDASLLKKEPLKTSWRSRPELVDIANKIFTKAFEKELKEEDIQLPEKARPYTELDMPCLFHWDSQNNAPEDLAQKIHDILYVHKWKVIRKKRDDESDDEYSKSKCVDIEPKDIAVLCRTGSYVTKVASAFRAAGIPVSATDTDILNCAEVQLIFALLRYIADNDDMEAKANITHLLGEMNVKDIILDRFDFVSKNGRKCDWIPEGMENLFKLLSTISARISALSVSDIISQMILELGLYEFVQKWDFADARRQNLGLLQRLAEQYEEHCLQLNLGSSISGFMEYISDFNDEINSGDTSSNTVKVMTYHKAKGLEWNLVCLYNLNNEIADEDDIAKKEFCGVKTSATGNGTKYIHLFPNSFGSPTGKVNPCILKRIKETQVFKERSDSRIKEERRLLYVGFTRARDYLVSFSKKGKDMSWIKGCGAGPGIAIIDGTGKVAVWADGLADYEDISGFKASQLDSLSTESACDWKFRDDTDEQSHPKFINPSKAALKLPEVTLTEVYSGNRMQESIKNDDKCGTCIHNIFAAFNPETSHKSNVEMAERIISGLGLSDQLTSAESVIESAEQFNSFLSERYPGEGLSMKELPFILQLDKDCAEGLGGKDGQVIRGEIDLVHVTDSVNKKCVLVDYKSYHGSPNINSTDENVRKHYSGYAPQLLAYKTALNKAGWTVMDVLIYYHVQGRVVKMDFK